MGRIPLIASSHESLPKANLTFKKVKGTRPCRHYPWDPLFDPLTRPDFYEVNYKVQRNPDWCIQLPNTTNVSSIDGHNMMWAWSQSTFGQTFVDPKFDPPIRISESPFLIVADYLRVKQDLEILLRLGS